VIDVKGVRADDINQRAEAWIENEMRRLFPHHYADAAANPGQAPAEDTSSIE
jgi:1-acyl-sn-glycerol-3-phosphate acyltransferase